MFYISFDEKRPKINSVQSDSIRAQIDQNRIFNPNAFEVEIIRIDFYWFGLTPQIELK